MDDKILAGGRGTLVKMYEGSELSRDAVSRFPWLASELDEADGHVHLLLPVLGGAVLQAVEEQNLARVIEIWGFLEEVLSNPRVHPEIEVALAISFVDFEDLSAHAAGREAIEKMPLRLKMAVSRGNSRA